jgi:hypothetical protein
MYKGRILFACSIAVLLSVGSGAYAQTNSGIEPEAGAPVLLPYGDTNTDLAFVPLPPCRIIDTRVAGGQIAAATTRDFRVTGTGFTGQGGIAGSCGVPVGASAAFINFVAVNPAGPGDFRVTAFGTPVPTASFLNYAAVGLNIANGVDVAICQGVCASDFTIQADASASHLVADVMGYFKALPPAGRAFAAVQRTPVVAFEPARTRNFTAVTRPSTGIYCLTPAATVPLGNVPIFVTVEWGNSLGFDLLAFPVTSVMPFTPCTGTQLQVRTYQFAAGGTPVLSDQVAFHVFVP